MKILLILGMSVTLLAQTEVTTPLTVLAPNDDSAPSVVQVQDQAQHTIGFIAPPLVTQIVVSSCTAANPTVCTLANPRPTTIQAGGTATLSGALGAGCSGLNATHAVSAVATSTITLTFNAAGCTYTANSATLTTSIYWQLPAEDGNSADCIARAAPYVLTFGACGAGSAPPFTDANPIMFNDADPTKLMSFDLSGFTAATTRTLTPQNANYTVAGINIAQTFSATQTMQDIEAAANLTYKLGVSNRFYSVSANRFDGAGVAGTTSTNSYITTRKLELWDDFTGLASAVSITSIVNPGISTFNFKDSTGGTFVNFISQTGSSRVQAFTDSDVDLGAASNRFKRLWLSSLIGTGTRVVCATNIGLITDTGCGGAGGSPFIDTTAILYSAATPANTLTASLAGLSAARTWTVQDGDITVAGIDRIQTWTTTQNMRDIEPVTNLTYKLGLLNRYYSVSANRFEGAGVAGTTSTTSYVTTRKLELWDDFTGLASAVSITGGVNPGLSVFNFKDSTGTSFISFVNQSGSSRIYPITDADVDLGASSTRFKQAWLSSLAGTGTRDVCATAAGLLTVSGCPSSVAGANIQLSNLGTTAINADLLWSSDNARDIGTAATRGNDAFFGGVVRSSSAASSTTYCELEISGGGILCQHGGTVTMEISRISGTMKLFSLSSGGTRCMEADNSGFLGTSALTGNCVTTAGGQSIAGTTTLSTVSVSSAIAGTHNMSGNETVTGNFYNRSFSGSGISCAGVADGWTGWDTAGQNLIMCAGGARYRVNLAAY